MSASAIVVPDGWKAMVMTKLFLFIGMSSKPVT